jgi:Cys-rich protein (TIGR01571 family)
MEGRLHQQTNDRRSQARARNTPALYPLQTDPRRFSYGEAPEQLNRPGVARGASPTTTIIDDSPSTPEHPRQTAKLLPVAEPGSHADERPHHGHFENPYDRTPLNEIHPAHFAPYAQPTPVDAQAPSIPLKSLPVQSPAQGQPQYGADPPKVRPEIQNDDRKPSTTLSPAVPEAPVYNPQSFAGPNSALLETHRPGQMSHPNASLGPKWRRGMCELDAVCCLGLFCPCILYGKTQYRLSQKANRKEATDLLGYKAVNGACGLMAIACGFQCGLGPRGGGLVMLILFPGLVTLIQHVRIRKMYRLEGNIGDDCLKACCCCCCILMQDEREVTDREQSMRRFAGPSTGAYASPEAMFYPPPPR